MQREPKKKNDMNKLKIKIKCHLSISMQAKYFFICIANHIYRHDSAFYLSLTHKVRNAKW